MKFDYMSAGIPVITTKFGSRGIENKNVLILAEINNMSEVIVKYELANYDVKYI